MTAPETAAEVLAEMTRLIAENTAHESVVGGFKTYLGHLIDFRDRLERALARGREPFAWYAPSIDDTCTAAKKEQRERDGVGAPELYTVALYTAPPATSQPLPPEPEREAVAAALARMDDCRAGCDAGDPFYADVAAWDVLRKVILRKAPDPAAAEYEQAVRLYRAMRGALRKTEKPVALAAALALANLTADNNVERNVIDLGGVTDGGVKRGDWRVTVERVGSEPAAADVDGWLESNGVSAHPDERISIKWSELVELRRHSRPVVDEAMVERHCTASVFGWDGLIPSAKETFRQSARRGLTAALEGRARINRGDAQA